MKKYLLLYTGGSSAATKEEGEIVMKDWMAWFDKYKDWVIDGGFPTQESTKFVDNMGNVSEQDVTKVSGYSIFKTETLEEVLMAAKECPQLKAGGSVEIKEELPLM